MKCSLIIFFILISYVVRAQQTISVIEDEITQGTGYRLATFSLSKNRQWAQSPTTKTFHKQFYHGAAYIALNKDSTFEFIAYRGAKTFLTVGGWKLIGGDEYTLNWNRGLTYQYYEGLKSVAKYGKNFHPFPLKLEEWKFVMRENSLTPMR